MLKAANLLGVVLGGAALAGLATGTTLAAPPSGDTITLGSALSLTGKYSAEGIHTQNGYELGIKMINENGGVKVNGKTYKLEVKYYDDESTPARTAQLLERLIQQDGVDFILGPYSSATTLAAAPVVEKFKRPMIEAEGASRQLFSQGYKYTFAVLSTADQYLASTIDFAAEIAENNGKKPSDVKVAMVFENDAFSLDVRAGVEERVKKYGMKVVVDDKMPADLNDISATLTKVKALKPDVLVASGHDKGASTTARQMKEMKVDVPLVAITQCESADLVGNFGAWAEGILCPTQWSETLTFKDDLFGTAMDYNDLFKKTYPSYDVVPYQSAQATAAIMVWKDALERAGSFDPEKVRDAIAATDMMSFYGPIAFLPEGNNAKKGMVLRQIQNGDYNVVAPSKYASHKVEWPRKMPGS